MKKKHTNVDIIAELQKLVDSHVDSYKEDFDIDKRIIRCAAESKEPEDKVLMWFCRPHGTHCLRENQVFIQGTRDHNTYRFYAEQTHDECIARVIVPKEVRKGKVYGDVFEVNYREQAANVAQNSVAPDHDRLTFADGYMLDAPCRNSFDAAMALVGEHGSVKTHQTLPKDADALAEVLTKQKSRRDRLPEAERTEVLAPLPVAELRKYEAVKQAHPEALVCFAQNGYFELYGKDAEKAAPLLGKGSGEESTRQVRYAGHGLSRKRLVCCFQKALAVRRRCPSLKGRRDIQGIKRCRLYPRRRDPSNGRHPLSDRCGGLRRQ